MRPFREAFIKTWEVGCFSLYKLPLVEWLARIIAVIQFSGRLHPAEFAQSINTSIAIRKPVVLYHGSIAHPPSVHAQDNATGRAPVAIVVICKATCEIWVLINIDWTSEVPVYKPGGREIKNDHCTAGSWIETPVVPIGKRSPAREVIPGRISEPIGVVVVVMTLNDNAIRGWYAGIVVVFIVVAILIGIGLSGLFKIAERVGIILQALLPAFQVFGPLSGGFEADLFGLLNHPIGFSLIEVAEQDGHADIIGKDAECLGLIQQGTEGGTGALRIISCHPVKSFLSIAVEHIHPDEQIEMHGCQLHSGLLGLRGIILEDALKSRRISPTFCNKVLNQVGIAG